MARTEWARGLSGALVLGLASGCAGDAGPLEAPTGEPATVELPPAGLDFIGGQASGACIDHIYFQAFGVDGTYTLGFANWSLCIPPEQQGVGLCRGTWERLPDGGLRLGCDSTDPISAFAALSLQSTFDVDPAYGLTFVALVPDGVARWVGRQRAEWRSGGLPAGFGPSRLAADVTLTADGALLVGQSVAFRVQLSIRTADAQGTFDERLTGRVDSTEAGTTYVSFVEAQVRYPNEAWIERWLRVTGDRQLARNIASVFPAVLRVTEQGRLAGGDFLGSLPAAWRPTEDVCLTVGAGDPPTPDYAAFCAGRSQTQP